MRTYSDGSPDRKETNALFIDKPHDDNCALFNRINDKDRGEIESHSQAETNRVRLDKEKNRTMIKIYQYRRFPVTMTLQALQHAVSRYCHSGSCSPKHFRPTPCMQSCEKDLPKASNDLNRVSTRGSTNKIVMFHSVCYPLKRICLHCRYAESITSVSKRAEFQDWGLDML
jgi:hypothetical protein